MKNKKIKSNIIYSLYWRNNLACSLFKNKKTDEAVELMKELVIDYSQHKLPQTTALYAYLLKNNAIVAMRNKNYLIALKLLKDCAHIFLKQKQAILSLNYDLISCYYIIALCLYHNDKFNQASTLLAKCLSFLSQSKTNNKSLPNKFVELEYLIEKKMKSKGCPFDNLLTQIKELSKLSNDELFTSINIPFILNFLKVNSELESPEEELSRDIVTRAINHLSEQFKLLSLLKFKFQSIFKQCSLYLLYFYFYRFFDLYNRGEYKETQDVFKSMKEIFGLQIRESKDITKLKLDYYTLKIYLFSSNNPEMSKKKFDKALKLAVDTFGDKSDIKLNILENYQQLLEE